MVIIKKVLFIQTIVKTNRHFVVMKHQNFLPSRQTNVRETLQESVVWRFWKFLINSGTFTKDE